MALLIVKNFEQKEYVHGIEVKTQDDCDNAFRSAMAALRSGSDLTFNLLNPMGWTRFGQNFDGADDVQVLVV